ncbi:MAG: hypothetical protein ACOC2J_02455, partial [bacterium]
MDKYQKMVFEKMFDLDLKKEPIKLLEELDGEISADRELVIEESRDEDQKLRVIKYDLKDKLNRVLMLSIAAGLPTVEFLRAENIYKKKDDVDKEENDGGSNEASEGNQAGNGDKNSQSETDNGASQTMSDNNESSSSENTGVENDDNGESEDNKQYSYYIEGSLLAGSLAQ